MISVYIDIAEYRVRLIPVLKTVKGGRSNYRISYIKTPIWREEIKLLIKFAQNIFPEEQKNYGQESNQVWYQIRSFPSLFNVSDSHVKNL